MSQTRPHREDEDNAVSCKRRGQAVVEYRLVGSPSKHVDYKTDEKLSARSLSVTRAGGGYVFLCPDPVPVPVLPKFRTRCRYSIGIRKYTHLMDVLRQVDVLFFCLFVRLFTLTVETRQGKLCLGKKT